LVFFAIANFGQEY